MLKINDEIKKYNLVPRKYFNKNNVVIISTDNGDYVFKKNFDNKIFDYLNSRNFNYYPQIISDRSDEYMVTRFIPSINVPLEQKYDDMLDLVSLLHNKTTHYKQVDEDEYSSTEEEIINNILYLYSYYNDLMTLIETKVYLSPSEYLLCLNVYKIYKSLDMCKILLGEWHKRVEGKHQKRLVVLHNNLRLEHFIENDIPYLISWDKAKIDSPVFDIYKLFKNNPDINYEMILKRYEKKYPFKEDERILLCILLLLPDKIEFDDDNYNMCLKIRKMVGLLDKAINLSLPYYFKDTKNNHKPEKEYNK